MWFSQKTQRDLWRCGYSSPIALENVFALRNFLICAFTVALVFWLIALEDQPLLLRYLLPLGIGAAIVLIAAPRVLISSIGEARVKRIASSMPDGLDLIAMAMSGGASFQAALDQAAEQLKSSHRELAYEFSLISQQSRAGSVAYALSRFQTRMDWPALTAIIDNLSHAVSVGSGLRSTLETLSDRVRQDRLRSVADRANRNVVLCYSQSCFAWHLPRSSWSSCRRSLNSKIFATKPKARVAYFLAMF